MAALQAYTRAERAPSTADLARSSLSVRASWREAGYTKLNVISAIGTRPYYRNLGFVDNGLYQQKPL